MRRPWRRWLIVILFFATVGGLYLFEGLTHVPVVQSDLVGTWKFAEPQTQISMVLTFKQDGSFHQDVFDEGAKIDSRDGKWKLVEDSVELGGLLQKWENGWSTHDSIWLAANRNGQVTLRGGIFPDPDCYSYLTRQ